MGNFKLLRHVCKILNTLSFKTRKRNYNILYISLVADKFAFEMRNVV